ncbi:hypothetical protein [Methylobacterium soli]|uniref:Uncharacterized protein n=1 Tax=Methylobacterium soli TaxID=553447 RepID=A0A6L3SSB7_9HYPH|nr:hypothetical protein [Methylobacterium soli]KAB1076426.1 hypothetical protein F6X53_23135 [Methylobacterium soli]GJE43479.1 hypothetical protein AEGHOMDF_2658 [Methylobacterium soli]
MSLGDKRQIVRVEILPEARVALRVSQPSGDEEMLPLHRMAAVGIAQEMLLAAAALPASGTSPGPMFQLEAWHADLHEKTGEPVLRLRLGGDIVLQFVMPSQAATHIGNKLSELGTASLRAPGKLN